MQALLAAVRRLNAEAVESAQQDAQVSAERDAAVADASRLRDDIQKVEEEKANLAAALDAVMDGAQIEKRTARAKADAAQREVRRVMTNRTLLTDSSAMQGRSGLRIVAGSVACELD